MVIAQTQTSNRQGDLKESMTAFLVDSKLPGVKIHKNDSTIGPMKEAKITFTDVIISDGKTIRSFIDVKIDSPTQCLSDFFESIKIRFIL